MVAYRFPSPEPLQFSDEEQEQIVETVMRLYRREIQQRQEWANDHEDYDAMHRGVYRSRALPWPNAADLHVQVPFWLVDSITTRQVQGIFGQTPLVGGEAHEDDDYESFRRASSYVRWAIDRSGARQRWSLTSKTRNIHGMGVAEINYVTSYRTFREETRSGIPSPQMAGGMPMLDDDGKPIITYPTETQLKREVKYQGPILTDLGYDDVIAPMSGDNLQPCTVDNPHGADFVFIRQMESLSLIWKKRESSYQSLKSNKEWSDKEEWLQAAPSQDRSQSASTTENNNRRDRRQDRFEGRNRSQVTSQTPKARPNPEFEVLKCYMPWEIESVDEDGNETTEETEVVFFVCVKPQVFMGGFRLSDALWTGQRPLLELHYHKVPGRLYSMGVMEIGRHLSAELDAIHNMRIDVGFATNLPFFFYRASSAFNPDEIELKPLKGVPVDDINDVRFPQMQNVTSFYHQEEQLLYSLIERVFGITDLFLGVSPTHGAAARHATGFVGTQQEALSRMSEILQQDADAFSFLCHTFYNLELQHGPPDRMLRLSGDKPFEKVSREQLRMKGEYDFKLGANAGMFSSYLQQQRAQAILQLAASSPFVNGDPGRRWEAESNYLHSIGETSPERFIGPKDSVAPNSPKSQDEENGEMIQAVYGDGVPAPVHPNDNDQDHLQKIYALTASEEYQALAYQNSKALLAHAQLHIQQAQRKQQQAAANANMAAQPAGPGPQPGGPALGQERIEPQLRGVGNMGAMGDVGQASGTQQTSQSSLPTFTDM